jgi:1-deoxy-D-xylulose-5-phosphate synthase
MRFAKPLDEGLVRSLAATHECIVTIEENAIAGGAGSAVSECLAAAGMGREVHRVGIPDRFIEHGSREDCLAMAGLDAAGLEQAITRIWRGQRPARAVAGLRPAAV